MNKYRMSNLQRDRKSDIIRHLQMQSKKVLKGAVGEGWEKRGKKEKEKRRKSVIQRVMMNNNKRLLKSSLNVLIGQNNITIIKLTFQTT